MPRTTDLRAPIAADDLPPLPAVPPGARPVCPLSACPRCRNRKLTYQPVIGEEGHVGDLWDWNCFMCGWEGATFRRPATTLR